MISTSSGYNGKQGVALIIVLGLVAVLMITTIAFTTTMRVERAGSANLRHSTLARQVVNGALSYALAELDYSIPTSDIMPLWRNTNDVDQLYWTYWREDKNGNRSSHNLWKDTLVSIYPDSCDANLLSAGAERYLVPGIAYKGYGKTLRDGGVLPIDQPQWIPVKPDNENILGRFAFIIFNNSGLLDVNAIHKRNKPRLLGQDPGEIHITTDIFGSEFPDNNKINSFFAKRDNYGEFSTVAELLSFKDQFGLDTLASFDTYSYQPSENEDGVPLVDISGTVDKLKSRKSKIIEAFSKSGLNDEQAAAAYLALIDYVDGDSFPEGSSPAEKYCRPVSEKMPVFSGGEALVTIIRTEGTKIIDDPTAEPGTKKTVVADPTKCEYEIRVMGKVPFVWNFDEDVPEGVYNCEGRMFVDIEDGGSFENKFSSKSASVTMSGSYDNARIPLSPAYDGEYRDSWVVREKTELINELCVDSNGKSVKPDLSGLEISISFAGRTYCNGNLVRIFPYDSGKYDDKDYGISVTFNPTKEHLEFMPKAGRTPYSVSKTVKYTDYDGQEKTKEVSDLACNIAHKIVWTEIFDPSFACREFEEYDGSDMKTHGVYRASVDPGVLDDDGNIKNGSSRARLNKGAPTQYLSRLNNTKAKFSDFDMADDDAVEFPHNNDEETDTAKRDKADAKDFVEEYGYFKLNAPAYFTDKSISCKFVSPLTDYILEHPEIVCGSMNDDNASKSSLGILADGVQYSSSVKSADPGYSQRRRYVRNEPLESVGELGYIQIGPYSTIRLYDHGCENVYVNEDDYSWFSHQLPECGYHTVLDYFTTAPKITSGKININSSEPKVLAAAYFDMPVYNEHCDLSSTDSSTCKRFSADRAFDMAYLLASVSGGFHRLSDFGKIFQVEGTGGKKEIPVNSETHLENLSMGTQILYGTIKEDNRKLENIVNNQTGYGDVFKYGDRGARNKRFGEFERESLIRNACGLFTTRGQSFTILLRAESFSSYYGGVNVREGTVNAAKTAIAQVWRDSLPRNGPLTGELDDRGYEVKYQINPYVIRYFKIIDE